MRINEEHEPGKCYACGEEKPVRWKNLYTIGSEGTWLCLICELIIVNLLRDMAMKVTRDKIAKIKAKKIEAKQREARKTNLMYRARIEY